MIRCFVDMDNVLVDPRGKRENYDTMDWMPDGKRLWKWLRPFKPTLLSQLPDPIYERCAPQKRIWAAREVGPEVDVIVVPDTTGKVPYASPRAVLIDDSRRHMEAWRQAGGLFILHHSAEESIAMMGELLQ